MNDRATVDVPDSHADLLNSPLTGVLSTVGADGQPQSTAVWYLVQDGVLKLSILTTRQKYKNLLRNPKATLFVADPANPYRTLEVRATTELLPDPSKSLLPVFSAKYSVDLAMLDQPGTERVIVILRPTRVVTFG